MLFNSLVFIGAFLPITLIGWYALQKIENPFYAKAFLTIASLVFYSYYNLPYGLILIGSLLFNFGCSRCFTYLKSRTLRRLILGLGIAGNLGLLFYFKYMNFFLDNCRFLFHTDWQLEKIALPLGISFYTFQQLSYLLDRYKGSPDYSLADYSCFITFFPQLIAGPIVLHGEFIPQLQERKFRKLNTEMFFDGLSLFILGLAKKVLLADVLAIIVNAEFENIINLDAPSAWVTLLFYTFQLYFDFSGYCDMARGLGKMFGFILPENFNSPLMATSATDFWRRWHMTLSRFLISYVYIPLGGNRKGLPRKCLNLLAVFLVSGIWHGANWTFIVWGLIYGLAIVFETLFPRARFSSDKLNRLTTGLFFMLSLVIFRSDSLSEAFLMFRKLFAGGFHGFFPALCNVLQVPETYIIREALEMLYPAALNPFYMGCVLLLLVISLLLVIGPKAEEWLAKYGRSKRGLFLLATLFTWSFISLSQVSTFLYFNF